MNTGNAPERIEQAEVSPGLEQAALAELTANWNAVAEGRRRLPIDRKSSAAYFEQPVWESN